MKLDSPVNRVFRRANDAAPVLALALLLVMPLLLVTEVRRDEATLRRNERIQEVVADVPWQIGRWRGQEVPVPSAAEDILRPNALLSREYREIGGRGRATLVIVHCSDVRDMVGHYPPVCYPNAGWIRVPDEEARGEPLVRLLDAGSVSGATVRRYAFRQIDGWGAERRIRIFNFFVLPDGRVATELDELRDLTDRTATSALGVAQIQLVLGQEMTETEEQRILEELLRGLDDCLAALGREGDAIDA